MRCRKLEFDNLASWLDIPDGCDDHQLLQSLLDGGCRIGRGDQDQVGRKDWKALSNWKAVGWLLHRLCLGTIPLQVKRGHPLSHCT